MLWTANLAYVVGLISTDGSLSKDGRHIVMVSKDYKQILTFKKLLKLENKITIKASSFNPKGVYYQIQFGNKKLYIFLLKIGLFPNKTKTISSLKIPVRFFWHFLRGVLDGDGYTYSYWDKRWKNSFMLYLGIVSASKKYLEWINDEIKKLLNLTGKINFQGKSIYRLIFAKKASILLLKKMYYNKRVICLERKRQKINDSLKIIQKAGMLKLVDRLP